ncbi:MULTISPECIES: hypothetical protein [unclassified Polaromonas]|jgi:hypothetical protein|uniref:hypothetical protein n=1 Tax=unclassified Polaromonas TaxID=2638319 RepID=UPI0025DCC1CE|nr:MULTISPECIES: hypothetical protein [unclassified Polaromonas]HQR98137.1 hypothetical protein [Polaromonas sp.]HQS38843.1 hypothetical protein [Polaromonas sp.]HQS88097.1 hypothetical protein [Polaromonas sp.]
MKKPFRSGDMVILVSAKNPAAKQYLGQIHKLGARNPSNREYWRFDPPLHHPGYSQVSWWEADMRPIRDQPGNESFVVEARKKLPRTKDTPATINERGELQT